MRDLYTFQSPVTFKKKKILITNLYSFFSSDACEHVCETLEGTCDDFYRYINFIFDLDFATCILCTSMDIPGILSPLHVVDDC
jgi:hypothetical protein